MPKEQVSITKSQAIKILGMIWLASNLCDRLWLALDRSVPAWDQSNHLTLSLKYLDALQNPQLFDGQWWRSFWMLSTKYPPLTYILTAPFQQVFGTGNDQALLVNFLYSAILLISTYRISKTLFSGQVGLWAAGLCVLLPRLYEARLTYLIDTPLMTLTVASFCCLTIWRSQKTWLGEWLWAVIFGISWGLALLTKQSVMFFIFVPLLWLGVSYLWQRKWSRIAQLITSFLVSVPIWMPWYRTNWIYLFSTAQNSNAIPATLEGDPPLNTLAAWTYYWNDLPKAFSWALLIVPLVGLLLHLLGRFPKELDNKKVSRSIAWLALYFISAYLICSAIFNKDNRYIMSYLPILAVFLAYCLTLWRGRWQIVRWLTVGLAFLVMCGKLFPLAGMGGVAIALSPGGLSYPYLGAEVPNPQVIEEIIETTPYLRANLGVIPSTPSINHDTLNYFGALEKRQVYGRELGSSVEQVAQDERSLDWLLAKTGDNGMAREAQLAFANRLETNPAFRLQQSWQLPDDTTLKLYHRRSPSVTVEPLSQTREKVYLDRVIVPTRVPPGVPVPITYEWSGSWEQLESGLVLLTWIPKEISQSNSNSFWLHDRGIGMGTLYSGQSNATSQAFRVIEQTAMLPDAEVAGGDYILTATYLNRATGETYPLTVPPATIAIDPNAPAVPAPELDLVTQLRKLALNLQKGPKGLAPVFEQVARLNQYDPIQDYLEQAAQTLEYRLTKMSPIGDKKLDWTYGLVLARVLQEDAPSAIAALKNLVQLDPNNAYAHAYLAFVYLYDWQPKAAQKVLQPALELKPDDREIQALNGIAALMQGNLIKAWMILSPLL
ncbi:PMT family glycosyltransferase, 4-amino-4-deoxy-L-arabinose transferase [Pleurocapsa sp. PCC 7327]|uniref:phospholipid carrier-dependent glycosyltransferase n=1 Tax=Pleurocapsa sp. PCC 7327 TaxID=118163 RepID=UPI00029FFBD1|nr:phospholipid carrier-dependent glycosyltransferase [Pleurocapsa sp. PCC 7327]AFY75749.1 PMT family glycosyltransferase, 4-amino-4-deoxy-L-arabinose transferase [Pleurocapsa sp. PCC 7327]